MSQKASMCSDPSEYARAMHSLSRFILFVCRQMERNVEAPQMVTAGETPACDSQQTIQVEVEMEVVVPPLSAPRLSLASLSIRTT